jgi:hypothetical protein
LVPTTSLAAPRSVSFFRALAIIDAPAVAGR